MDAFQYFGVGRLSSSLSGPAASLASVFRSAFVLAKRFAHVEFWLVLTRRDQINMFIRFPSRGIFLNIPAPFCRRLCRRFLVILPFVFRFAPPRCFFFLIA